MTFSFSAHVWYARRGHCRDHDMPNFSMVLAMLADIERQLAAVGGQPIAVVCEYWPKGICGGDHAGEQLARITIEAEPGDPTRPLRSWFQWQHPRWHEGRALPFIEGARPIALAPAERVS